MTATGVKKSKTVKAVSGSKPISHSVKSPGDSKQPTRVGTISGAIKKPVSRERLLINAADMFSERGYAYVSLDEIVGKSGVTKGSLFWHFSNKRDSYVECAMYTVGQAFQFPDDKINSPDPKKRLHQYLEWVLAAFSEGRVARRLMLHAIIDQDVELMRQLIEGPLAKSNETMTSILRALKPTEDEVALQFFLNSILAINDEFLSHAAIWAPNTKKLVGGKKTLKYLEKLIMSW